MLPIVAAVAIVIIGQCPIYHNIHNLEPIRTRVDVRVIFPDGSSFEVPVINGYKPAVTIRYVKGVIYRDFTYKDRSKWSGKSPMNYVQVKLKKKVKKKVAPPLLMAKKVVKSMAKSLPSDIKSKEANFTKKFPRY